jgi:ubiquitin carboxyl-terminal hydrolase 20/33
MGFYFNFCESENARVCRLRNGTKHSSITRLPQILIIHLKRFRHEGAYNTKLRTRISFPLYNLDMTPFMHPDSLRDAKGHLVQTKYDLCGVISHRGQNMECPLKLAF